MVRRDVLDGGTANDSLSGGDEADTLEGGAGDDTLDGGAAGDVHVFGFTLSDTGADEIVGFTAEDQILFIDPGVRGEAADLTAFLDASVETGGNLVYDAGGDQVSVITLIGVSKADLGASNFDTWQTA